MEPKLIDEQNTTPEAIAHKKKEIGLSLAAFGLSAIPVVLIFLGAFAWTSSSFLRLLLVMSPIAGFIAGIQSLCRGKKRIGVAGAIFSIAAIALPASVVLLIIGFFVGASTGLISLM